MNARDYRCYAPETGDPPAARTPWRHTPMRMLFVSWNDDQPPAQFSVPDDCTLTQLTSQPVTLGDTGAEFMLDASRVRAAYLIDVPDGTFIGQIEPVPVESADIEP